MWFDRAAKEPASTLTPVKTLRIGVSNVCAGMRVIGLCVKIIFSELYFISYRSAVRCGVLLDVGPGCVFSSHGFELFPYLICLCFVTKPPLREG